MIDHIIRATTCFISCGNEFGTGHLVARGVVLTARHCVRAAIESGIESGADITLRFSGSGEGVVLPAAILDHSEELDACLLSLYEPIATSPLPLALDMPREGSQWQSFGYPAGKTITGHRLSGNISHILSSPAAKIDIDLTVDTASNPENHEGLSGAAVINEGAICGMIRIKTNGTLGAISTKAMATFLNRNGISLDASSEEAGSSRQMDDFPVARRVDFQSSFEAHVLSHPSKYLFLEGAHGMGKTVFCTTFVPNDESILVLGTYSIVPLNGSLDAYVRSQPEIFFDWLAVSISRLLFGLPARQEQKSYHTLVKDTEALLKEFSEYCQSKNQRGIVFIDGVNEIPSDDPSLFSRFFGLMPRALPSHINVVLTAPNYISLAAQLSNRVTSEHTITLPALSLRACESYCWQELNEERAGAAFISGLCAKAQGHPLYLRYLINYANEHPADDDLNDFPVLSGPIEQYYEQIWTKLLGDAPAIQLLAIMARLRSPLSTTELVQVLSPAEQAVFLPTTSRIQHLLFSKEYLEIYHSSFKDFLISKTTSSDEMIHTRLGTFCQEHNEIAYGKCNIVYHFLRSNVQGRVAAVTLCDQSWADSCVTLGVEPDILLLDVRAALEASTLIAPPVETFRLLLLTQRLEFRYNVLLTQSADLMAMALIALGHPNQVVKHSVRYNTLITHLHTAARIGFALLAHDYFDEANSLFVLIKQKCEEAYSLTELGLKGFLAICELHTQTLLFLGLINQGEHRHELHQDFIDVRNHARNVLHNSLSDDISGVLSQCMANLNGLTFAYLLYFQNTYIRLEEHREATGRKDAIGIQDLISLLLKYKSLLSTFDMPKKQNQLTGVFEDIQQLLNGGASETELQKPVIVDTLIQFGAPISLVRTADKKQNARRSVPNSNFRASNGVDVDFTIVHQGASYWTTVSFIDVKHHYPLIGAMSNERWQTLIEEILRGLFFCEGRARRAIAEANESIRREASVFLVRTILPALAFSLTERVGWERSYAIPETIIPFVYASITRLLIDCFPELVEDFLKDVMARAADQLGLYSEGYRDSLGLIASQLLINRLDTSHDELLLGLLGCWRDHVLSGLENRHELVPELLRLIPLFVQLEAHEEAERLYQRMLAVSMGPSWYKEDQFGLMVTALNQVPLMRPVGDKLPMIAGYLHRASGEMTFQRYIRYEKSRFLGSLFSRRLFKQGCNYFKQQVCGGTEQLISEWESCNGFDAPTSRRGNRYPGGALDEQGAILEIVRHGEGISWRLRWALLEIYHCGDERYTEDFATEYANIANEVGSSSDTLRELIARFVVLVECDTSPEERKKLTATFSNHLNSSYQSALPPAYLQIPLLDYYESETTAFEAVEQSEAPTTEIQTDTDEAFYMPGVLGRQSSLAEADTISETANKQFGLGNRQAAKSEFIRMLEHLQTSGWSIWGNLSKNATIAEQRIKELSQDGADLLRAYAPLIKSERYAPPWRVANHLISQSGSMLSSEELSNLLDEVFEHIHLMVGDASQDIASFSYLNDNQQMSEPDQEVFALVLWLIDHPKWIRREKAASSVAWLLQTDTRWDKQAAEAAFDMSEGYVADVICGVLDHLSGEQPLELWSRCSEYLNLDIILAECKHLSRLATLKRIAERAGAAGSDSGRTTALMVASVFRKGLIALSAAEMNVALPRWANSIDYEWDALERFGIMNLELRKKFVAKCDEICKPLSIEDAQSLEKAIAISFRESADMHLSRWESKLRFALNRVLVPYIPVAYVEKIASALHIHNPAMPEMSLSPNFDSPLEKVIRAVREQNDYTDAIGYNDTFFLNYEEMGQIAESEDRIRVQVTAVLVPSSGRIQNPIRLIKSPFFTSRELPNFDAPTTTSATCFSLLPAFAFFGIFTPGYPTQYFTNLIKAQESDFQRVSWRKGRSFDTRYLGQPIREGCLLAVKSSAVHLPDELKLAWMIRVDGKFIALVDVASNRLKLEYNGIF